MEVERKKKCWLYRRSLSKRPLLYFLNDQKTPFFHLTKIALFFGRICGPSHSGRDDSSDGGWRRGSYGYCRELSIFRGVLLSFYRCFDFLPSLARYKWVGPGGSTAGSTLIGMAILILFELNGGRLLGRRVGG